MIVEYGGAAGETWWYTTCGVEVKVALVNGGENADGVGRVSVTS